MKRERSNRCSEAVAFAVVAWVALALVAAPVAGIATEAVEVPEQAAVGEQVTATVRVTDLFRNPNLESWTLSGETELRSVTWTVTTFDQGGNRLDQAVYDGRTFTHEGVALESGVAEIEVKATGTVPDIEAYSYEPPQSFVAVDLAQTRAGGTTRAIENWSVHHYDNQSRPARQVVDNASAAVASAERGGAATAEAESTLQDAVDAYDGGNFELARRLANEARSQADAAEQSRQLFTLALYAAAAVVVLVVAGALYWYLQQRRAYDRLS